MAEKSKANALKEELFYTPKHMATVAEDDLFPKADVFAEGYKDFMSNYKTEREITAFFKAEPTSPATASTASTGTSASS